MKVSSAAAKLYIMQYKLGPPADQYFSSGSEAAGTCWHSGAAAVTFKDAFLPTHHCILILLLLQSIVLMALCTVSCASFSRTATVLCVCDSCQRDCVAELCACIIVLCWRRRSVSGTHGGDFLSKSSTYIIYKSGCGFAEEIFHGRRKWKKGCVLTSVLPPASQCSRVHPLQREHKNLACAY